jgi:hypothetical protein
VAIAEIEKGRGAQFDPVVVDALAACYKKGKIQGILQNYHEHAAKSISCPYCSTFLGLPEDAEVGYELQCTVCHRHVRLQMQNEAYYGKLITPADAPSLSTPLPD